MDKLRINQSVNGKLVASLNDQAPVLVIPTRCFPWSRYNQYISLRTHNGKELTMIRNLKLLDEESRIAVEMALSESSFILQIVRIIAIDTEFEIRNWQVKTRQGAYIFQTKLDEWPQKMNKHGLLIRDVAGNLLQIENVDKLDDYSKSLVWPFID